MKPLNRPMFKRGGKVSSRNNGIVSGFENGGRVGYEPGGAVGYLEEMGLFEEPQRQKGLSTSDYLRIASAGAEIMGAQPTGRSGFIGALQAASPALSGLGQDLATSSAAKEQAYQDKLEANRKLMAGAALSDYETKQQQDFEIDQQQKLFDFETGQAKILAAATLKDNEASRRSAERIAFYKTDNQKFDFQERINSFNDNYSNKIIAEKQLLTETDETKITQLKNDITRYEAAMGIAQEGTAEAQTLEAALDNILTKDTVDALTSSVSQILDDKVFKEELELGSDEYYAEQKRLLERQLSIYFDAVTTAVKAMGINQMAEGGRVGLQNGGDPMMEQMPGPGATQTTTMEQQPTQITFAELRKRLPPEVTDKVITLLTQSEEALLDFTRIQVPEDINKFNQKYGADLTLPTQVA